MTSLLLALLAAHATAAAQGRSQLNYEVIVAHVGKNDAAWDGIGRKLQPMSQEQAAEQREALADDRTRVMARPLLTAHQGQEAFIEQRSGEEFVRATLSGTRGDGRYTMNARVEMDVLRSPLSWSGDVPAVDGDMAILGVRPKKNLVVLIRVREARRG